MLEVLGILVFALALLASIALHEIGHLLPAKKFGVKVPQYMVGFGPTIWSRTKGETEYGVKAIPMGGYIRMIGMYPPNPHGDSQTKDLGRVGLMIESARNEVLSEIAPEDEPRTFYRLSVPKKLAVMFGGPFMNLIIATVLFAFAFSVIGRGHVTTTVREVVACVPSTSNPTGIASNNGGCGDGKVTAARAIGLAAGDKVIAIDGTPISSWTELGPALSSKADKNISVAYIHNGEQITKSAIAPSAQIPVVDSNGVPTGKYQTRGFLGISPSVELIKAPVTQVPGYMASLTAMTFQSMASFPARVYELASQLFTDAPRNPESPVSVVGVGRISGQIVGSQDITAKYKAVDLITLIASLNLFLFAFNMVPILPLDGGHIAGAIYEGLRRQVARIRRKPLPGPVDTAKMLPIAYAMSIFLIAMSLIVLVADFMKPLSF
jgi:membrane-associated protease RseP (regulator of RpoE activity)